MIDSQIHREIEFASVPENINLIESLVEELKTEIALSQEMEANVLVSLSEAVNNAIFHGNKTVPAKKVKVVLNAAGTTLTFEVQDEGTGFNAAEVKDPTAPENIDKPTGRGIFLMKHLTDKVDFLDGGRKVILTFSLH